MDPGYMWTARALRLASARKPAVEDKLREQTTQQQGIWQVFLWPHHFSQGLTVTESGIAFQQPSPRVLWEGDTESKLCLHQLYIFYF